MTLEELKTVACDEFRAEPTGTYYVNCRGNRKPKLEGVNYRITKSGRIRLEEWIRLAKDAVNNEGKSWLLEIEKIECKRNCAWLKTEKDIEEYALRLIVDRISEKQMTIFDFMEG